MNTLVVDRNAPTVDRRVHLGVHTHLHTIIFQIQNSLCNNRGERYLFNLTVFFFIRWLGEHNAFGFRLNLPIQQLCYSSVRTTDNILLCVCYRCILL